MSIALAFSKYIEINIAHKEIYRNIILRAIKIYAVGMFLWLLGMLTGMVGDFGWDGIRWTGVLQRISVVFLISAFLYLTTDWKTQAFTCCTLLLGYWILMAYIPVPGIGKPDLTVPMKNWAHYLDSLILPGYMWEKTWDPEGIFSTLPAIATGISGMLVGKIILRDDDKYKKIIWLFFAGFCSYSCGVLWDQFFPINKNLWTSSYVMYTSGLATMALAASIFLIDLLGYKRWVGFFRVYGSNAITAYVLSLILSGFFCSSIIGGHSINSIFVGKILDIGLSPKFVSFLYAIFYMLICYIPIWILYKKKIYTKL